MRNGDAYEAYLPSCIAHLRRQDCPVKMLKPYITSPVNMKWREGEVSKLFAITDRLNNVVDNFMKSGASHLWIIDGDIEVPSHGLCDLLKLDVDIASGIYCYHNDWNAAMFGRLPNNERYNFVPRSIAEFRGCVLGENERVGGGNGCMLIKRRVFERYHSRVAPMRFVCPKGRGSDVYFWYRAQKAGFTARISGNVVCGHLPEWNLEKFK